MDPGHGVALIGFFPNFCRAIFSIRSSAKTAYCTAKLQPELVVQRALENMMRTEGTTCLVIAHRLSTVVTAHRVALLERGELQGCAPHAQLMEECEAYAKLVQRQTFAPDASAINV